MSVVRRPRHQVQRAPGRHVTHDGQFGRDLSHEAACQIEGCRILGAAGEAPLVAAPTPQQTPNETPAT
jgi:hypothetical protein